MENLETVKNLETVGNIENLETVKNLESVENFLIYICITFLFVGYFVYIRLAPSNETSSFLPCQEWGGDT